MSTKEISPLPEDQLAEYKLAKEEKRQPRCVHCEQPLSTIVQVQFDHIKWLWDAGVGKYIKKEGEGAAEKPECFKCGARDWDFVDFDLVDY